MNKPWPPTLEGITDRPSSSIPEIGNEMVKFKTLSQHLNWATSRDKDVRDFYAEQIARRLIATRRALGLTQAELCRRSGVQQSTYNQFEKAINIISPKQAVRLCEALGLTLDWIYLGDPGALPPKLVQAL